uniref:Protein-tyrosine-phosphatase n=1 Tax=Dracunculus medinensis TaxID=318479 RepID=A0A158Q3K5_DRAME
LISRFRLRPDIQASTTVTVYPTQQHDIPPADDFAIVKDLSDPSSILKVILPKTSTFRQYITKVVDISSKIEKIERDANRTFVATEPGTINITDMHAGHQYSVSIYGRKNGESMLIKEESFVMDPLAPDFNNHNSSILSSYTNITLRSIKPYKALQDIYKIEYSQVDPVKFYPNLEIHDIAEQKYIEIYLGNLEPGRNYNVSVIPRIQGLEGRPWRGILTTKPYAPSNLIITDTNLSCISLSWHYSNKSGVDRFRIMYQAVETNLNPIKVYALSEQFSLDLCNDLKAGENFRFSVQAEKNREISEAVNVSHILKPMPPERLEVIVDYQKRKFIVSVDVPSEQESIIEACHISIVSQKLDAIELNVDVIDRKVNFTTRRKLSIYRCFAYVNLWPGRRYEISAKTMSKGVYSNKVSKSLALEPAFDMNAFGLHLSESDNGLRLEWPTNGISRARLLDIWKNIVGNDSSLHIRIDPQNNFDQWKEQQKRFALRPFDMDFFIIPDVQSGACYKIQIYTVTSSGIVSTQKFEEFLRLNSPSLSLVVEEISKTTAVFRSIISSTRNEQQFPNCKFHIMVTDTYGMNVYNRTKPISSLISRITLEGLRPFHRYSVDAQIVCGRPNDHCPVKRRSLIQQIFETRQDRPGPIRNLTLFIINPYSVQLTWLPPISPNGIITHYIVKIHPMVYTV